jgi:hypothetical protein
MKFQFNVVTVTADIWILHTEFAGINNRAGGKSIKRQITETRG